MLLHGHIALAIPSLPETDPQILEHWGYADEVHLVSNFGVTRNGLRDFYTLDWSLHVRALPENRLRRLDVLKYTTQLPCVR